MNYIFKINGKLASISQVSKLYMLSEEFEELLETGSITVDNNVVISIHEVGELSLDTLKLALYSTLNYLLLDSPDGTLPKKYASLFEKLGNELIDMDIDYDKVLSKLVKLAEVIQ